MSKEQRVNLSQRDIKSIKLQRGYDVDQVRSEINQAMETLGRFPTETSLKRLGNNTLISRINGSGGWRHWQVEFGVGSPIKTSGYWKDEGNIRGELQGVITDLGHFPSSFELQRRGRYDLVNALARSGGILRWRERMGVSTKRSPSGYFSNQDNISRELNRVISSIGHFPLITELVDLGENSLITGINTNGGFTHWRNKFGYVRVQKDPKYWQDPQSIRQELLKVTGEIGHFPTSNDLRRLGKTSLIHYMSKTGGPNYWREQLGFEITRRDMGFWQNPAIIEKTLLELQEKLGHFPTRNDIDSARLSGLLSGINRTGGLKYWKKRFDGKDVTNQAIQLSDYLEVEDE